MKNEVRYMDGAGQPVHALYSRADVSRPDEICMEMEEGSDVGRMSVLGELLDYVFADGMPGDWRWAMRRFSCVIRVFRPVVAARLDGLFHFPEPMKASFPLGEMRGMSHDRRSLERLVMWFCGGEPEKLGKKNRRKTRDVGVKLYLLAQGARPELLRVREGKAMTFEEMAAAFRENRKGARQRWSWRAKNLLAGLPRMEWQRGDLAREGARLNAVEMWKKRKTERPGNS